MKTFRNIHCLFGKFRSLWNDEGLYIGVHGTIKLTSALFWEVKFSILAFSLLCLWRWVKSTSSCCDFIWSRRNHVSNLLSCFVDCHCRAQHTEDFACLLSLDLDNVWHQVLECDKIRSGTRLPLQHEHHYACQIIRVEFSKLLNWSSQWFRVLPHLFQLRAWALICYL